MIDYFERQLRNGSSVLHYLVEPPMFSGPISEKNPPKAHKLLKSELKRFLESFSSKYLYSGMSEDVPRFIKI